jgi:hypothetical protein
MAFVFGQYLWHVLYGADGVVDILVLECFLGSLCSEAYYFFLKLIPMSVYGQRKQGSG